MHVVGDGPIIARHQADWFCQVWIRSCFTDQSKVEDPPIKRLMLRSNSRKGIVGVEVFSRQPVEPDRGIRQSPIALRKLFVDDKAGGINDNFACIEFRLQDIGEDFERRKVRMLLRADVNADRTG